MVIFNSYVKLPEGNGDNPLVQQFAMDLYGSHDFCQVNHLERDHFFHLPSWPPWSAKQLDDVGWFQKILMAYPHQTVTATKSRS